MSFGRWLVGGDFPQELTAIATAIVNLQPTV